MVLNQALLDRRGPLQFGSLVAVLPREGKRLKIVRLNLETERKENIVGRARKRVEKKMPFGSSNSCDESFGRSIEFILRDSSIKALQINIC